MSRIGRPARPVADRFHASYVVSPSGCWIWQLSTPGGYGKISLEPGRGASPAHRYAYELLVGPIPDGLVIDHLCRVRSCVNPEHLEPVSHRTNILRGESFSATYAAATHCSSGHEFTPENTYVRKDGDRRQCRACLRSNTAATAKKARAKDPESVRAKDAARQRRSREKRRNACSVISTCDKS